MILCHRLREIIPVILETQYRKYISTKVPTFLKAAWILYQDIIRPYSSDYIHLWGAGMTTTEISLLVLAWLRDNRFSKTADALQTEIHNNGRSLPPLPVRLCFSSAAPRLLVCLRMF